MKKKDIKKVRASVFLLFSSSEEGLCLPSETDAGSGMELD